MKYEDRFKIIASVFLILVRDRKILLLRRLNTGYADGQYSLPAGHVDANEPLSRALCREAHEEIGVNLGPKDVKLIQVMHRTEECRLDFFFTTDKKRLTPTNAEPHKSDHVAWFPLNKLPKNMIPCIRAAIRNYQKHIFYSEFGWK
jgi:8-oxo-dGTP diphosphatase